MSDNEHRRGSTFLPLTALVLIILSSSCTRSATSKRVDLPQNNSFETELPEKNTEQRRAVAKNAKLFCEIAEECEPAVAMMTGLTENGVSRCTAFLISPTQIVTNDHCVELALEFEPDCSQSLFFQFTQPEKTVRCKQVLKRSQQIGVASNDYAVIELEEPMIDREFFKVSQTGFQEGELAKIYRIQPEGRDGELQGFQSLLKCQASYSTYLYPAIDSEKRSLMTFGDCITQGGNSGAPALKADGSVGAILQARSMVNPSDPATESLNPFLLDGNYGSIAIATHAYCLEKNCEQAPEQEVLPPNEFMKERFHSTAPELLEAQEGFSWKTFDEPILFKHFLEVPKCLNSPAPLVLSYTAYRLGINARLQSEWRVAKKAETEIAGIQVHYRPKYVGEKVIEYQSDEMNIPELAQLKVNRCQK